MLFYLYIAKQILCNNVTTLVPNKIWKGALLLLCWNSFKKRQKYFISMNILNLPDEPRTRNRLWLFPFFSHVLRARAGEDVGYSDP